MYPLLALAGFAVRLRFIRVLRRDRLTEKVQVLVREDEEAVTLDGHATRFPANGTNRCVTTQISNGQKWQKNGMGDMRIIL